MLLKGLNLRDDHFVCGQTFDLDPFHFDTCESEQIRELRCRVAAEINVSLEPIEGDLHKKFRLILFSC